MADKIKVIYFATPYIALKSLEYLYHSEKIEVQSVVTQPDKPAGRGGKLKMPPIKEFALANNIKIFQPKSLRHDLDVINALKQLKPDFFVTFAYGQILSQEVLDIPKYETINLHASLLPKYRGANPIKRVLINGEKETGICTMITELGLDCGAICLKEIIKIPDDMTCIDLEEKVASDSPELLEKTLIGIYENKLCPTPQCSTGVCNAPKLTKEEIKIDWTKSAVEIHNLVRGIYKSPSAYFVLNNKMIKVLKTEIISDCKCTADNKPGEIVQSCRDGIIFLTGHGFIKLLQVKPEGRKEMCARDWYNGVKNDK